MDIDARSGWGCFRRGVPAEGDGQNAVVSAMTDQLEMESRPAWEATEPKR